MSINSYGDIVFNWNEAVADHLLRSQSGEVARDLARRAVRVESAAKVNASGRPGPRIRSGRLRASITWTLGEDASGLYADIGSNVVYSKYLELGTERMRPYPFLVPALPAAAD